MNVLIVEDNQALAQMWARHLERKGATVTIAASDETATEALESLRLDVIVLNLDLRTGGALAICGFRDRIQLFLGRLDLQAVPQCLRLSSQPHGARGPRHHGAALRQRTLTAPRERRGTEVRSQAARRTSRPCGAAKSSTGPIGTIRCGFTDSWL